MLFLPTENYYVSSVTLKVFLKVAV
jgi:hypothetical protein